ncbi:TonB-dependent receptor [Mucilaginibacter sp. L3T2-6]|uniref:SusC/RagA family TonB-linked outer membrane protein n=1 Tax=Mucilaginibacter sp. L3T2-6 TaxID=3062491 RepID=UPI00267641B7|nr:TonB-dependent receptor [Mucilaginibacter sp. L3T2-6]MDO3643005.1 TonB-dependent receptor [Mucilaginibacter sp. L3T2-6]MDV6215772.1 TonB-dependent receptor [Mucilaginibacter sp. L3T2-6]
MKKNLLTFFLLFSGFSLALAQSKVIKGKVTDQKDGSPLPGVTVVAKGAEGAGTQTDINGLYTLTLPDGVTTVIFRYIGYKDAILTVKGATLDAQLQTDSKQLSEVVVVGYGTQKRGSLTGAISSVSGKDVAETPVTSFEQAIQGRAAGVNIQAGNGKLGQGIKISIRGQSSISAGTQPLVVIDGIIVNQTDLSNNGATSNPLADINFNDIDSYQILKDASASAIYGARASNGVILITTKKGKAGTAKINFNAQFGYSEPSRHRKFLNSEQWLQIEKRSVIGAAKQDVLNGYFDTMEEALDYENLDNTFTALAAGNTNWASTNTDWEKQAYQTAPQQQYDLNVSGGNDKTTYYMGLQALDQKGILKANALQRYSGRVNVETKLSPVFTVGMNLNFTHTYNERLSNDDQFSTPLQLVALSPITPVIDPRTGLISGTPPGDHNGDYPLYYNALISVKNAYYHTSVYRTLGNVFANWEIVKHLTFRSEFGVDQTNQNEDSYFNSLTAADTGTPNGFGQNTNTSIVHFTVNNFLTYKNTFATDHTLDVTAGTSYEYSHLYGNDIQGKQFPSDSYKQIASAAVKSGGSSTQSEFSFVSYFARANYAYKSKYLLSASVREDASSRFGANNRYGTFPSASIGWVLSQEKFLNNWQALSELKLRASVGLTGNAEIGDYSSLGLFSGDAGYNGTPGQRFSQLANPNLKWEKTLQYDLGFDFGFFNNRFSGGFDYYRKNTRDLLLNVNVPQTLGIAFQTQNLGRLYNQGLELTLSGDIFVGAFKWNASLNASYNINKVTYTNGQVIDDGADLNRVIEGQPVGVFYGPQYAGVDPANGDAIYYKNTKKPDGTLDKTVTNNINEASPVPLGNPTPKYNAGLTNTFNYKNFDLSFTFQGSFGNKIYNGGGQYMSSSASNGLDNQTIDQLKYWDKPGDITNVPEPREFYANGTDPSSRYLSSGSYVRLKTVTLGYTFPSAMLKKIKVERLRIFMNAYNLFIITKYTGWDPEVNTDWLASNINIGNDFYAAPQPRTVTVGVNVGF